MSIKVFLADDHQIVRQGLKMFVNNHPEMEVVGESGNGKITVQKVLELLPDVVIMDISMPELNGIDAARQICATAPHIKIIALSMHSDQRFVVEMLKAGACAYLLKESAFEELINAVLAVCRGQFYLSPRIAGAVIEDYLAHKQTEDSSIFSILTQREREVLQLLAEGKSTKKIAGKLNLSIKTVDTHRQNLMGKLKIDNFADLVKLAIREGLTSL